MSTQILAPCCYHPTTVLLVDDDQVALMANKGLISKYAVCKAFLSPMMADSYLKKTHLSDFADRCKKVRSPNINTHNQDLLSEIYKEIYNPARFQQISVAVLDYQMPGMNGLQLASLIRKRHPHIKILMLSGQADFSLAVEAFNDRKIDQFLRKDTANLPEVLRKTIRTLQWQYFLEMSNKLFLNLIQNSTEQVPECLKLNEFNSFIAGIMSKSHMAEYYLLDGQGNFMLLDSNAKTQFIAVRSESEMIEEEIIARTAYDLHPTENAKQILEMIQSRHAIPFFCSQPDVPVDLEEWESFMYPIEKAEISGQTFYYASVSNYCDFYQAKHKILSVNQFIRSAAMA